MKSSSHTKEEAITRLNERLALLYARNENIPLPLYRHAFYSHDDQMSYYRQICFSLEESNRLKEQCRNTQHALDHIDTHPQLASAILAQEDAEREKARKEEERRQEAAKRRRRVDEKVAQVIQASQLTPEEQKEGIDVTILKNLANYMKMRSEETSILLSEDENLTEIEKRADAINQLIPLIKSKNIKEQLHELKEKNIAHLKGLPIIGSKKLYTLFSGYRKSLMERPGTVELSNIKLT